MNLEVKTGKSGRPSVGPVRWRGTVEVSIPSGRHALDSFRRSLTGGIERVPAAVVETRKGLVLAVLIPSPGGQRWTTLDAESGHYVGSELGCREAENDGEDLTAKQREMIRAALIKK